MWLPGRTPRWQGILSFFMYLNQLNFNLTFSYTAKRKCTHRYTWLPPRASSPQGLFGSPGSHSAKIQGKALWSSVPGLYWCPLRHPLPWQVQSLQTYWLCFLPLWHLKPGDLWQGYCLEFYLFRCIIKLSIWTFGHLLRALLWRWLCALMREGPIDLCPRLLSPGIF